MKCNPRIGLATLYGAGLSPKAPGTAGSLAAAVAGCPLLFLPQAGWVLLALTVVFTWLGTLAATVYMRDFDCGHDPGEIVVDELAGLWLTYALVLLAMPEAPPLPLAALGFATFRLFDILKPWPICLADRKVKGGFGVMLDDLLAAFPAALVCGVGIHQCFP